jgi:hypothetical protein
MNDFRQQRRADLWVALGLLPGTAASFSVWSLARVITFGAARAAEKTGRSGPPCEGDGRHPVREEAA